MNLHGLWVRRDYGFSDELGLAEHNPFLSTIVDGLRVRRDYGFSDELGLSEHNPFLSTIRACGKVSGYLDTLLTSTGFREMPCIRMMAEQPGISDRFRISRYHKSGCSLSAKLLITFIY